MKKQQLSPWALGLGALDLGWENVRDVKRAVPLYYPLPFRVVLGSAVLALGTVLVAMDLVRWQPLRAWWYGELTRRGEGVQHRLALRQLRRLRQAAVLQRAQAQRKERDHDLVC